MTLDKKIEKSEDADEVVGMYIEALQEVCGTRETGHSFQGNMGTKVKFRGEQRNKDSNGEQGTKDIFTTFWKHGNKPIYFMGIRKQVLPRTLLRIKYEKALKIFILIS